MKKLGVTYNSSEKKTEEQAHLYLQTHEAPHRYLAYRDIPIFIKRFLKGKKALDYGCGTGASSSFLYELDLNVIGVDISLEMIEKARSNFSQIQFDNVDHLNSNSDFDLIFSSFVLFELSSKDAIIKYLNNSSGFLKKGGLFIGVTGSEHLHSPSRHWMTFDANFPENSTLKSGNVVKLLLKQPRIDFYDYYWKKSDYLYCFEKAGFEIIQIHDPLGSTQDPFPWQDELSYSPFTVFVAKKT